METPLQMGGVTKFMLLLRATHENKKDKPSQMITAIITLVSTLLGIVSATIPNWLAYLIQRKQMDYDIELTKLKLAAAQNNLELSRDIEDIKAVVEEGRIIHAHDGDVSSGNFVDTLRNSVRPVITYTFFAIFVGIKLCVATIILVSPGLNVTNMKLAISAILDDNTMAIFSTIMGYYFGSRSLEKMQTHFSGNFSRKR